jgi:hypothetical protein
LISWANPFARHRLLERFPLSKANPFCLLEEEEGEKANQKVNKGLSVGKLSVLDEIAALSVKETGLRKKSALS